MLRERLWPRCTSRLVLRPLAPGDTDALHRLYGDWEIAKWLSRLPWPFTLESAQTFVVDAAADFERGSGFFLAIETRVTHRFVGTVSLRLPSYERNPWTTDDRLGILGYAVLCEQQGNGYASEATASVVELAFNGMGLERLRATVLRSNAASRRVLERLGFTIKYAGVREKPRYGGPPRLGDTFILERSDWREAGSDCAVGTDLG